MFQDQLYLIIADEICFLEDTHCIIAFSKNKNKLRTSISFLLVMANKSRTKDNQTTTCKALFVVPHSSSDAGHLDLTFFKINKWHLIFENIIETFIENLHNIKM